MNTFNKKIFIHIDFNIRNNLLELNRKNNVEATLMLNFEF